MEGRRRKGAFYNVLCTACTSTIRHVFVCMRECVCGVSVKQRRRHCVASTVSSSLTCLLRSPHWVAYSQARACRQVYTRLPSLASLHPQAIGLPGWSSAYDLDATNPRRAFAFSLPLPHAHIYCRADERARVSARMARFWTKQQRGV